MAKEKAKWRKKNPRTIKSEVPSLMHFNDFTNKDKYLFSTFCLLLGFNPICLIGRNSCFGHQNKADLHLKDFLEINYFSVSIKINQKSFQKTKRQCKTQCFTMISTSFHFCLLLGSNPICLIGRNSSFGHQNESDLHLKDLF